MKRSALFLFDGSMRQRILFIDYISILIVFLLISSRAFAASIELTCEGKIENLSTSQELPISATIELDYPKQYMWLTIHHPTYIGYLPINVDPTSISFYDKNQNIKGYLDRNRGLLILLFQRKKASSTEFTASLNCEAMKPKF